MGTTLTPSSGEKMPREGEWDEEPDMDRLLKSERKHEWISEPKYKRMFDDIEDSLQGVMGKMGFVSLAQKGLLVLLLQLWFVQIPAFVLLMNSNRSHLQPLQTECVLL